MYLPTTRLHNITNLEDQNLNSGYNKNLKPYIIATRLYDIFLPEDTEN
jgi:hypothetical protein